MPRAPVFVLGALLGMCACARSVRKEVEDAQFLGEGLASYYGDRFDGRRTASGERFSKEGMTAAHQTLRFGTCLIVINLLNERSVRVRVNDRGPYGGQRILDLSEAAARALDMLEQGVVRVRLYRCPDGPGQGAGGGFPESEGGVESLGALGARYLDVDAFARARGP